MPTDIEEAYFRDSLSNKELSRFKDIIIDGTNKELELINGCYFGIILCSN